MKVVILAGGYGTRISEESVYRPKPMVEIGDKPILWHIMKHYSHYGFNDFIICCGYKQQVIKEWFANYYLYNSDVTFDFVKGGEMKVHTNVSEPWKVTLVDTGLNTMTGGRIKRIQRYIEGEPFMLTYGDGVSDVDLYKLLAYHKKHQGIVTLTGTMVEQRFGLLETDDTGKVTEFREKSEQDGNLVNSGFMVVDPKAFDYISGDEMPFEREPLEQIAKEGKLYTYKHEGFWRCMDTQRDKMVLDEMWESGNAPWKVWE
ncbi:MAG: glucose-1-phosphate cytidylyltransferase [Lachnospiraceae bacterium]|nr:glucose-1-phosphate cytidylyltransferase [Lachnospiraceae bacterium]